MCIHVGHAGVLRVLGKLSLVGVGTLAIELFGVTRGGTVCSGGVIGVGRG